MARRLGKAEPAGLVPFCDRRNACLVARVGLGLSICLLHQVLINAHTSLSSSIRASLTHITVCVWGISGLEIYSHASQQFVYFQKILEKGI